ncbi:hypothetical protein POSPLADRAFT_1057949 [Postia placenta MAD-698-R-SB12]|uniref:Sec20 C-terminal domain-containing protein n=1 Tax=Postia placenta MAD-698-R-SB12 TaxID=670580 RepID=A0A1X6MXA1_9APHY|nr:hypothetical protein POSPLADRAFT_1057949 [Postia placenta MAD-698-R-SB12]OSX61005.1 hypothetical protein POSPLADRAFT_1057949 [Postia placenta MAD-698-R-SB12]
MAPIPSTLDETTRKLVESLDRRRKDLSEFQIQRLRTCTGPLPVQQQYAAELREDLDGFARQVESLDVAVDDQRTERDRRELRRIVEEFRAALVSLKKDTRAALLASKRAIDSKQVSNRDELLRSSAVREKQDLNEKVTEDALMKANTDVTEALQRTLTLMQGELEKSVLSTQLLDSSTAALRSTLSTHDVLDGLLTTSKHLITALEKSDWLDRMLVLAGLVFFVLTVAFILKQRLVDRSLRIAFWWTRFLPDFSSDAGLLYAEGKRAVSSAVSSVVATTSAVAGSVAAVTASATPSAFNETTSPPSSAFQTPLLDTLSTSLLSTDLSEPTPDLALSQTPPASSSMTDSGVHDEL